MIHRAPIQCHVCFFLLLAGAVTIVTDVFAVESSKAPETQQSLSPEKQQDQDLLDYMLSKDYQPLRSIIFDQEAPLLGIKWGSSVLYDVPLNGEPEGSAATLRQAKLSYSKKFRAHWDLRFNVNYNSAGDFELGNNYLNYTGWKTATATIGVFDPAFSLEKVSKREGTTFMERAMVVEALSEHRSGGIGILKRTPNAILNAGVFFLSPDYQGKSQSGQALVLHYVHAPLERSKKNEIWGGRRVWTGISLSYRTNVNESNTQFRSQPEVATADEYYVDTGTIDNANTVVRLGIEFSKVSGPFSWQTEMLAVKVSRDGRESLTFTGAYAFASWFLTGESRNYNSATGAFLTVTPKAPIRHGGKGAFELAARASFIDLNDGDVIGGKQSNLSLGLNWYANERFRIMLNLIKVLDVDRPGSIYDEADPLILALRGQWYLQ